MTIGVRRGMRILSREERWLWAKVASTYQPLKGKRLYLEADGLSDAPPSPAEEVKREPLRKKPITPILQTEGKLPVSRPDTEAARTGKGVTKTLPPVGQLERKTLRSVRRGIKAVDGVLDLHGMRQTEAHYALISFLRRSQARGAALVLVVTGKGGENDSSLYGYPDDRGVLKRFVPQWLAMPEMRAFVVSYGEAAQHHGGAGALYVRIRRQRI